MRVKHRKHLAQSAIKRKSSKLNNVQRGGEQSVGLWIVFIALYDFSSTEVESKSKSV